MVVLECDFQLLGGGMFSLLLFVGNCSDVVEMFIMLSYY